MVAPLRAPGGLPDGGAQRTGMLVGTEGASVRHYGPLSPRRPLRLVTSPQKRGLKEVTLQMVMRKILPKSERRGGRSGKPPL